MSCLIWIEWANVSLRKRNEDYKFFYLSDFCEREISLKSPSHQILTSETIT